MLEGKAAGRQVRRRQEHEEGQEGWQEGSSRHNGRKLEVGEEDAGEGGKGGWGRLSCLSRKSLAGKLEEKLGRREAVQRKVGKVKGRRRHMAELGEGNWESRGSSMAWKAHILETMSK